MEDDFLEELSSILSGKPVAKKAPAVRRSEYDHLFEKYGRQYGVDPDLLRAQTSQESGFNPRARSNKNAQGLMQIIPETAKALGVTNVWDPEDNIRGGAKYMRQLLDQFDGDVAKALAGYNAGPGAVVKYKGIPPYKETQDYVKRIMANYQGPGTTGSSLDIKELAGILSGQQPAVDIEELKSILSGTADEADAKKKLGLPTGTEPTVPEGTRVQAPSPLDLGVPAYKPEEVKTSVTPTPSIPNQEIPPKVEKPNRLAPPPAAPTKQVAKKKPEVPSEEGFSVSVEPGAYTVVDPSQGVMVDAGVQVDMAPRQVGKGTDDLNRQVAAVKVDLRGVEGNKGEYAVRRAYESIAGTYGLTPEMIDKAVTLRANTWGSGRDRAIDPNAEEGTVGIALKDIADLKGEKEAVTDERIRQVQARPVLEELPPEELFNKWNPQDLDLVNRLNETRDGLYKRTDSGNTLVDLVDNASKNLAAGVIGSGGRTMDMVTGLYRLANEVFTGRGTRDKVLRLSGNEEKIKSFRTDDLELAMREIGDLAKRPGAELEKTNGYIDSVVQLAGGLPGDLSRIMFMSTNPGGVVTAMSADMALQSAGRGESIDKVGMEAFKGALFGGIARLAGPVGQKWATNLADMGVKPLASKLGGGAAAMGFTAAGTYPTSRAFGADPKTALKETLFNTVFAVADTLPALTANTGRTIRVSDTEGNSFTVLIDRNGEIKEVQLPKDQPADMEIMDPAIAEMRKEYIKVAESATDMLSVERSRSFVDRLREAEFTRDGDAVAMNPQAATVLQNVLEYATRNSNRPFSASKNGFRGVTIDSETADTFVRAIERMRDEVLADRDTTQGIELNEFLIKFEDTLKAGNNEGAFYTKFGDKALDKLSLADRDEELVHLNVVRSGLSQLLDNGLPDTPAIEAVRKKLSATYKGQGRGYQLNEVIAQIFRRDDRAHLGMTGKELGAARRELFRTLAQVEDFDVAAFAAALEGTSKTGDRYAKLFRQDSDTGAAEPGRPADEPARTEASSPAVRSVQDAGTGSLGDSGRSDGRNVPEQFRDRRDLVPEPTAAEVTQPWLEVPIGKPTKETLQPWAPPAVPEGKAAPEVGDFVTIGGTGGKRYMIRDITPDGMARLDDASNPFVNALIDIPVRELEIYQKVAEKDTTPSVIDEVDVRDSGANDRFEEAMRDDSRVANAGGAKLLTLEPEKPEVDPAAVERGSIEPDGRVWFRGKIVEPSDEVTTSLLESVKKSIDSVTEQLDKLRRAPVDADGRVTDNAFLRDVFAVDHREYGKSKTQLIAEAEKSLATKQQDIIDITNANNAWKKRQQPARPTSEQAAVDQMVAEALPAPKADYNFINPERQTYLLSIANSKDAKITTAKVGGKDVTFLGNKKAKVMLQPEEVPFVEERMADKDTTPAMAAEFRRANAVDDIALDSLSGIAETLKSLLSRAKNGEPVAAELRKAIASFDEAAEKATAVPHEVGEGDAVAIAADRAATAIARIYRLRSSESSLLSAAAIASERGKHHVTVDHIERSLDKIQSELDKITTAKVGGQDVTFLGNKKAKVMLQPEEVPFVETALKDKEIDPQLAHLWQGSRHLYNPEILVEYPDGRQEYIEGKQKRFPPGTRVSRRGDGAVIVKYDKTFNLNTPEARFVPMLDGMLVGAWARKNDVRSAADLLNQQTAFALLWGSGSGKPIRNGKEFADHVRDRIKVNIDESERVLDGGIDPVTGDPINVDEVQAQLRYAKEALTLAESDRFKVGEAGKREVLNTKDILPEVPAGAKLVKEFPLGRIRNDKIGTGEGAQAYGYGHYAAEKKGAAEYYRTAGASDEWFMEYKGRPWEPLAVDYRTLPDDVRFHREAVDAVAFELQVALDSRRSNNMTAAEAIKLAKENRKQDAEMYAERAKAQPEDAAYFADRQMVQEEVYKELDKLDPNDFTDWGTIEPPGNLYRLKSNVPDEKTLRYDDKLTDQPEPVKQVADNYYNLKRINNGIPVLKEGEVLDTVGDGQDFYNKLKGEREFDPNAEVIPGVKGYIYTGQQAASLHLAKRGIGGLKFEDQASRGMQVTSKTLYKGQSPYYVQGLNSLEQGAIETVIDGINDDGVSPQQAINDAIGFYKNNLKDPDILEESVDYFRRTIDFLKTLDPNDFQVQKVKKTYNHVIFDGADIDVTRIFFASEFKKAKIFDKAKQDEILEFSNTHFPYLASLWRRPAGSGSPVPGLNQAAKEARQAARGLDELTLPQRVAQSVVKIYHQFTRQFEAINPNESVQMARVGDSFRLLSNLNQWAKTQAMNDVARVTADMDRSQLDIFEDVLILRDQQNAGEQGKPLNFGYKDLKEVEADLKIAEAAAAADPVISKALSDREKLRVETVRGLVKIGMLGDGALKNTRYYHRQVPQGADGNLFLSVGSKDIRVRKKGFQKERKGSITDPNTNYSESEVEWISQAHAQIRKTELLNEVKRAIDISGDLKAQAKIQRIKDWTELIPRTHRIWQPQEGSYFYEVMTIPDMLITDIFAGRHNVKSATAEMKKAFAAGQRKPEWVLPVEIANLMDDFELQLPEGEVSNVAAKANASWKQWQLINPKNLLPYNIRNMVSDLDVAMAYPGILAEMPGAIQDVWKYSRDKRTAAAAEIEQAIRDGVMDSGITFAEIPDISKTGIFKKFADSDTNAISKSVRAAWDLSKGATNARENWVRLAAYRHMKKRLDAGEATYGASTAKQVDALAYDKGRQAAKLARELVGDYGGISSAGRTIRKHMIPFYSWLEINAPRYIRLIKNASLEGRSKSASALGGVLKGTASTTRMGAKLALLTVGINVWNHTMYPDVEEKLMKTDLGRRPHIILGENEDGTVRIFQADTALRDMLDWVDAGDTVADIADLASGKSTATDKLAEAVKAPVNKIVQGLGPQYKLPAEMYTGESSFPSIFEKGSSFSLKSRPIRDRIEHLAQTFAVKGIYQRVTGRPQLPSTGPIGTGLDWFLTNRIDPAESIFWNVKSKVSDYRKKMGKSSPGGDYDEKSNTLFYYKQAIKWSDQMAAERYLKQYKEEFGGDEASLKQSLTKTHPLGGMAKADWPEFIQTLRPEELDQLKIAIDYYNNKFMYGEKGTPAENTTVDEIMQMLFPGKTAADIDSMIEIERRKDEADARKKAVKAERLATP